MYVKYIGFRGIPRDPNKHHGYDNNNIVPRRLFLKSWILYSIFFCPHIISIYFMIHFLDLSSLSYGLCPYSLNTATENVTRRPIQHYCYYCNNTCIISIYHYNIIVWVYDVIYTRASMDCDLHVYSHDNNIIIIIFLLLLSEHTVYIIICGYYNYLW